LISARRGKESNNLLEKQVIQQANFDQLPVTGVPSSVNPLDMFGWPVWIRPPEKSKSATFVTLVSMCDVTPIHNAPGLAGLVSQHFTRGGCGDTYFKSNLP
jgi:hypothetical protein